MIELELPDPCPLCEGLGWVLEADGGAGTARRCECRLADDLPRLLEGADIPPRYRQCRLSNFVVTGSTQDREALLRARTESELYVDSFLNDEGRYREKGLIFLGPPGVGKTHLAVGILRQLVERYRARALFVDFTSLIHRIQSTFDPSSPESKREILDPVRQVEVLVLDELASQKPSAWVNEILYLILNDRYTNRRPTLFTTNYWLDSDSQAEQSLDRRPDPVADGQLLGARIPGRLISRLYEMARPIEMEASDFRRTVKVHQH